MLYLYRKTMEWQWNDNGRNFSHNNSDQFYTTTTLITECLDQVQINFPFRPGSNHTSGTWKLLWKKFLFEYPNWAHPILYISYIDNNKNPPITDKVYWSLDIRYCGVQLYWTDWDKDICQMRRGFCFFCSSSSQFKFSRKTRPQLLITLQQGRIHGYPNICRIIIVTT